jgi:hypothetical protein
VKPFFDDVPLVGRVIIRWWPEAFMMDHRAVPPKPARGVGQSTSSPRSFTTRCTPRFLGTPLVRDAALWRCAGGNCGGL